MKCDAVPGVCEVTHLISSVPMASRRRFSRSSFTVLSGLALTTTLGVACGSDKSDAGDKSEESTTGGSAATGGQSGSGGTSATGGRSSTGGAPATGGQSSSGGKAESGGKSGSGGASQSGGQSAGGGRAGATGQAGEKSAGGVSGAGAPGGGAQNGGGGAGGSAAGASGSGGAPSTECTRALLDGLLDDYFAALAAGDPSTLPLAANLKFTENAKAAQLGKTELWMNAGETKYSQRALDTTACAAAAEAVIPEGNTDLPVALRIKVTGGQLTEIESIVVRPGDYTASFAVDSNPGAIIDIAEDIGWHDEVPEDQRATRQQLSSWIDKYFRAFPSGVCNVTSACRRLENGGGNFSCGAGASCTQNVPASPVFEPRVIVVDELRGIAAGFTIFDFQTTGHLDMHMIKMSGGQVHAVHAILRNTNGESGWD
jgi:hypothetical protein